MGAAEIAIGIIAPAIIALAVYRYRSVVTFDLTQLTQNFGIEANGPVKNNNHKITLERLELKNRGWKNLQKVRLHLEHTPELFDSEVEHTSTIGKRSVKLTNDGDDLLIEIDELPRSETISVRLTYFGYGGWSQYRDLKGAGASYKVARRSHWEASRRGVLVGVVVGGLYVAIQIGLMIASR